MAALIREFIAWLGDKLTEWLSGRVGGWIEQRKWVLVAIAVIAWVAFMACPLASVLGAVTTLQSCGCSGPVLTPTPTVPPTVTPSPTPRPTVGPTVTPVPGSIVSGTVTMWWDWPPDVGQSYYDIVPDAEAGTVTIECVGDYCPDGFPSTVELTQSGPLTYHLFIDLEARSASSAAGAVLASTTVETGIPAARTEPGMGQYDGVAPWSWSPPLPSGTVYDLWRLSVWRCDGLPDLPGIYEPGAEMDERWFVRVGVYEVP